jgi:putative Mg2+ transporter-C (MgtC) family protein
MDFFETIGLERTYTPQHILFLRLALAAVFGAMIGYEREAHGSAGLRTHILISVAAALFTLLAFEIFHISAVMASGRSDPIRAIEAVTAGIAFLGAGAIFQQRGSIQGLTTGAGMWLAGAVGVTCALGYYFLAFGVALFAVLVLAALRALTHREGKSAGRED